MRAAGKAFDRRTGEPVPVRRLRTYGEVLRRYHLHPEEKFLNGGAFDVGDTSRRHVSPLLMMNIGKEANDWEVQYYLGPDDARHIGYGTSPRDVRRLRSLARMQICGHGVRPVALATGLSVGEISSIKNRSRTPSIASCLLILRAKGFDRV